VIYTLMSLRVKHIPPAQTRSISDEMRGGLAYVRDHGELVSLIVLSAATTFLGSAALTFLPILTAEMFDDEATTYSVLMMASGAGSVVGALVVAWLGKFKRMGLALLVVLAIYGFLLVAFGASRVFWLSCVLLFLAGAAMMVVFSTITSLVQLIAPNEMRGRVMSIYMVAFRGGMPLGALASGYAATFLTAAAVLQINGILLVAVAAYFLLRNHGVREI
jgi:predicted MFS family arabinose efflux permease